MQFMTIEGCTKPISRVIKGSDYFYLQDYESNVEHIEQYLQTGGNIIDTAHIYSRGESEAVIGKYMEESKRRDDIVILTKGGISNLQPDVLHSEIMTSLEKLRTNTIEMYALHRDDLDFSVGDIIERLNTYIKAGTIQSIGASNWTPKRIMEANQYAKEHGLVGFTFNSPNLSLAKPKEPFWGGVLHVDDEMNAMHVETKLPCLSWSPLARGFFSGRFDRHHVTDEDIARVYYNDDNWNRYDRAEHMAKAKGLSIPEIALAYVANQSYPTSIIAGARSVAELQSCIDAMAVELTTDEMNWLEFGD